MVVTKPVTKLVSLIRLAVWQVSPARVYLLCSPRMERPSVNPLLAVFRGGVSVNLTVGVAESETPLKF
jgi:hypothetical protein